jgi:intein/homing endonuclease
MIDHIVIDVEIQKTIQEVPNGWDDTHLLGISTAVIYEYKTDRYRVYGPSELDRLSIISRLEEADRISGFNIWKFDFPVIYALPSRDRVESLKEKTNDILYRIWQSLKLNPNEFSSLHKGWGLDIVCKGTLGRGKTGYGGDAPVWFQRGDWSRLVDYCIDDVKLERDLTNFVDKYGFVVNGNTNQVLRLI